MDVQLADLAQARTARAASGGVIEGERIRIPHERLTHTREQQPHQRVDIRVRANRGTGILRRLLLVDNYRYRQALYAVHMRAPVLGQILLHERGKRVVELPPALRRDSVQHQRTLPGARNPREHRNLILGDIQIYPLKVILARPAYPYAIHVWRLTICVTICSLFWGAKIFAPLNHHRALYQALSRQLKSAT